MTGATGLIGRWLVTELTRRGTPVVALIRRSAGRLTELRAWVDDHGGRGELIDACDLDLDSDDLGLDAAGRASLDTADAVYHLAARFGFGLDVATTRRANVSAALKLVEACAGNRDLRRFIHISGYRTEGRPARTLDVDDEARLLRFYREHGAYEASKMEAHERVRRAAAQHDVPLTRVSPAMVIGDSRTGETTQLTGLAETLALLWHGKLPALAGTRNTWMPVVTVDFLASLLAMLPSDADSANEHYLIFDDRTPTLPELLELAAKRMGVAAPARIVPVGLLRHLPSSLTGVDSEALSFISDDRYDPRPLAQLQARLGLEMPPTERSLGRWVDHLLDTRFGQRAGRQARSFSAAGTRVFGRGDRETATTVLLHGVMLNEHSWTPITDRLRSSSLALDLPGLGRSAPGGGTPAEWMTSVLAPMSKAPLLVGHSLGTAFAVDYAATHPERVRALVLVSPFFMQGRASWALRQPWLMQRVFRFAGPQRLARALDGTVLDGAVLDSTVDEVRADALELLSRPEVAKQSARWLSWASRLAVRERLRKQLATLEMPVTLVVGERDPLLHEPPPDMEIVIVPDAGHHPQLTHTEAVGEVIEARSSQPSRTDFGMCTQEVASALH